MKRFTDTGKWSDPWFQDLPAKFKLFWEYICDNCNAAGVWKVNMRLAGFQIGETFDEAETLRVFIGRIEDLGDGKWWILKFCGFQYGTLSLQCKQHQHVLDILNGLGLASRVDVGQESGVGTTRQEKEKEKEEGSMRGDGVPHSTAFTPTCCLNTPAFLSAWGDWRTFRTQKRQKLTPIGEDRQIKMLLRLGEKNAILAIEQSIEKGWTGLFEPHENNSQRPLRTSNPNLGLAVDPDQGAKIRAAVDAQQ